MPKFRNRKVDVVIDVRSHVEYFFGHLPGAVCMPVGGIDRAIAERSDITTESQILVYCASGARSAAAAETLKRMGYRRVVDGGGYQDARGAFEAG
jgi:rhodanese-related sulfurtransferase